MPVDENLSAILQRAFAGCRIVSCDGLNGGVSARATVVELETAEGAYRRVVVRRPSRATLPEARLAAKHEFALLQRCAGLGVASPTPCHYDDTSGAVVLEYVDGAPDFAPRHLPNALEQMATALAKIHAVPTSAALEFLPRRAETAERLVLDRPAQLDTSLNEPELRRVLKGLWPWPQHNADVLLHGDFWPGNLLFQDGRLAAVIDWEESERGDPLADLAITRLDLSWAFGDESMRTFTECYREQTHIDWRNLPHWDLCVALRPMSNLKRWAAAFAGAPISRPDITEQSMRAGHERFVQQALSALLNSQPLLSHGSDD